MKFRNIKIAPLSLVLLALTFSTPSTAFEADDVEYFTDSGFSGTIKTMQHPAGEYYKGVTYVAYQGAKEDPYVAAYNHKSKKWTGPYRAGVSLMGKDPDRKIDNHGKPAMIIDDAGYIHLVFGGHGGMTEHGTNLFGNPHYGMMKHVVSKRPMDISEWEEVDNIPPFGTYNQFVKMDNGDIYLFYRHGAHRSNWVYQRSTDNGRTFEPVVSILKTKPRTDTPGIIDSWYAWFDKGHGDDIIVTYNYHVCGQENGQHRGHRKNSYYMVMDTKDHTWHNIEGEKLATPVTKELADAKSLVVDTGDLWSVRGVTRLDETGNPHIILYVGEDEDGKHVGPTTVSYTRWTGEKWTKLSSNGIPPKGEGDLRVNSPTSVSILLPQKTKSMGEVVWIDSTDGGKSFAKGESVISAKRTSLTISSFIRNAHPDARFIAAGKKASDKTDYRFMYLVGDNGSIKRSKAEAHHRPKQ